MRHRPHVRQAVVQGNPDAATIDAMSFQTPYLCASPLRGRVAVGGGAVVREIWPYKPVAHSSARR